MDAEAEIARVSLLVLVVAGIAHECPGHALPDELGADIEAIGHAHGQDSAVSVLPSRGAVDELAGLQEAAQHGGGVLPCLPAVAFLGQFWGVQGPQAHRQAIDAEGVAIDHGELGVRRGRGEGEQEGKEGFHGEPIPDGLEYFMSIALDIRLSMSLSSGHRIGAQADRDGRGGPESMTYIIEYVGMYDHDGKQLQIADGYHADDYLPDYDEQAFENENLAKRWVESNHKGSDVDGVEARFVVLPA